MRKQSFCWRENRVFPENRVFWEEEEKQAGATKEDIGATAERVGVVEGVVILQKKVSAQEAGLCKLGGWSGNLGWSVPGGTLEGVDAAEVRKRTG